MTELYEIPLLNFFTFVILFEDNFFVQLTPIARYLGYKRASNTLRPYFSFKMFKFYQFKCKNKRIPFQSLFIDIPGIRCIIRNSKIPYAEKRIILTEFKDICLVLFQHKQLKYVKASVEKMHSSLDESARDQQEYMPAKSQPNTSVHLRECTRDEMEYQSATPLSGTEVPSLSESTRDQQEYLPAMQAYLDNEQMKEIVNNCLLQVNNFKCNLDKLKKILLKSDE